MKLQAKLKLLPDNPGIYLYFNKKKELIYVGKATNLRSRVKSYFVGQKTPRPIEEMIHEVVDLKTIITDSVIEAIILEAAYIKKYKPVYNVLGKDDKSWNYLLITRDVYPRLISLRKHELDQIDIRTKSKLYSEIFGPFPGLNTRQTIKILRRLFGFCTCTPKQKSCLYYQMGQCYGVFKKEISAAEYKRLVIMPLRFFLRGNKKEVVKRLEKEMKQASKKEEFEIAGKLKFKINALSRIQDITLINKSFFARPTDVNNNAKQIRVEGYDISNLGSTNMVGSMVVMIDGEIEKKEYRKFKIKYVKQQSDVDCLAEVLERRLKHQEWKFPEVIMVDGGKPQVNRAKKVVKSFGLTIPVVGIAKGSKRDKNEFILGSNHKSFISFVENNKQDLIKLRDEAHRFAITFQRSTRKLKR